jgi:hydroxyacylglutathione hydrolase
VRRFVAASGRDKAAINRRTPESAPRVARTFAKRGQTVGLQRGRPASPPGFQKIGGITMFSRRTFLQGAQGAGLGYLVLSAQPSLAESDTRVSRPSEAVIFETVRTDGLAHLSYLIGDRSSGRAAVIDPRRDVDVYLELARRHGLTITHAVETHIHADFVSGSRELAARTGTAKPYVSVKGGARYDFAHEGLHDGSKVELGSVTLTAVYTPGHTPEHLSYVAAEKGKPWGFFSGDFLFADSVGRPDLLGAEQTPGLAKALFRSLRTALAGLPDDLPLYPAHGAGSPCGANICDRQSTIGHERRHNPALQFTDEAAFIDWVLRTAPPMPHYYPRMKKINAQGPEVLNGLPAVEWMEPAAFRRRLAAGDVQLIDNRTMLAFGGGHIAGALNLGPRPELSLWAGWMLDPAKPIALVLPREGDLPEVLRQFVRVGFTSFAAGLKGGMEAWVTAGLPVQGLAQLPVQGLNKLLPRRDFQLLDVRSPGEWDQGHIPGARYVFLGDLPEKLGDLNPDKPVVIYCASGYRSSLAASLLQANGFHKVQNVPGSYSAWTAAEFPVVKPTDTSRKASDTQR